MLAAQLGISFFFYLWQSSAGLKCVLVGCAVAAQDEQVSMRT